MAKISSRSNWRYSFCVGLIDNSVNTLSADANSSRIFSFLPPSTTIRRYHRTGLSTTAAEIGFLYCAIVSYASTRREEEYKDIIANMVALRSKLRRMRDQTTNVQYEVRSQLCL